MISQHWFSKCLDAARQQPKSILFNRSLFSYIRFRLSFSEMLWSVDSDFPCIKYSLFRREPVAIFTHLSLSHELMKYYKHCKLILKLCPSFPKINRSAIYRDTCTKHSLRRGDVHLDAVITRCNVTWCFGRDTHNRQPCLANTKECDYLFIP